MPQFLRYGDARALLREIKEKFAERKYNDIEVKLKSVSIPIKQYQDRRFKKGDLLIRGWKLIEDESEEEYALRKSDGEAIVMEIEKHRGDASRAVVKREYRLMSTKKEREAQNVSDMAAELDAALALYETGGGQYLSPSDFAKLIIDFLKNGSENDEGFLCDIKKSPTAFFYQHDQYVGNAFINDLLKRYGLTDARYQTIDDFPYLSSEEDVSLKRALEMAEAESARQVEEKKHSGSLFSKLFG